MKQNYTMMQALTGEQLRLLYQHASTTPENNMFLLMISTGMRPGELLALRWHDLNIQTRTLTIARTMHEIGPDTERPLHKGRVLHLPAFLLERLRVSQIRQQETCNAAGETWTAQRLIFSTNTGGYLSLSSLRRRLHQLLSEVELPPCNLLVLRHSTVVALYTLGVDPQVIQALLGFKLASSTMAHLVPLSPSACEEAIQRLMDYLSEETQDNSKEG